MKQKSAKSYTLISLGAVSLLLIVTTIAFAGGLVLAPYLTEQAIAAPPSAAGEGDEILAAYEDALAGIYDESAGSVVLINVTQDLEAALSGDPNSLPEGFPRPQTPDLPDGFPFPFQGQGSGFVWDDEGHIVTNFHVIQNAEEIEVIFSNGTSLKADVVGTDPDADLAVLEIDLPASSLRPLPLGDSDTLRVGQLSIAIGAPFGQDFTMTTGIVSAIGRFIPSGSTRFSIPEAIQTDAPMNPGNSGGPLLNRYGEVIGINTQILSLSGSNSGVGFAVPVNIAKRVVPALIEGGDYQYAWLGISGGNLPKEVSDLIGLPEGTKGAYITGVAENGPAEKAGLVGSSGEEDIDGQPFPVGGDIITAINGQPINGINDIIVYLVDEAKPGDEITLTIIHANGEEANVDVTLGERPEN